MPRGGKRKGAGRKPSPNKLKRFTVRLRPDQIEFLNTVPKKYQFIRDAIDKEIKMKYDLQIGNYSTHSMRKAFGRETFRKSGTQAELALVKLSQLFNHSNVGVTRRYIGINREELLDTYDLLGF